MEVKKTPKHPHFKDLDSQVLYHVQSITQLSNLSLNYEFVTNRLYFWFMHPVHKCMTKVEVSKENISKLGQHPVAIAQYVSALIFNEFPDIVSINAPVSIAPGVIPHTYNTSKYIIETNKLPWADPNHDVLKDLEQLKNVYHEASKPIFKPMVEEKTVSVTIGPDLAKFSESMQAVNKQMSEMAKALSAEWDKMFLSMKPMMDAIAESQKDIHAKPADYALKHKGMNARHKCPGLGEITHQGWSGLAVHCSEEDVKLDLLIVHLNDRHKWTREKIADWLDTLDEQPVFYPEIEEVGA